MTDPMTPNLGGNAVGQATANQILQALNSIAQSLKQSGSAALPGSIVASAGPSSGKFLVVTANGKSYAVPLYEIASS